MPSPPENAPTDAAAPDSPVVGGLCVEALSATRPKGGGAGAETVAKPARSGVIWAALVIVYVVWGSTYLAILVAVRTIPPYTSAALRFVLAGVLLAGGLAIRRGMGALRVTPRQLATSALLGVLLLATGNGLVVLAESRGVPTGVAALLIASVPLLVVLLRLLTGDRPRLASVLGVLLGFAGLAALVGSRGGGATVPLAGALLVLVAAVSWSVASFFSSRMPLPRDPFVASVYEMIGGGLVLAAAAAVTGEPVRLVRHGVSGASVAALAYLVVAGSLVAFTSYVWLLHHAPISLVSTYAYVNPVVAVTLGALFLREPITLAVLLSGAVIVGGVALVVSAERRPSGH
jgi:drug/metabolite transporter (DMT)-like permease